MAEYKGFPFISSVDEFVKNAIRTRQQQRFWENTPWVKATPGAYKCDNNKQGVVLKSIKATDANPTPEYTFDKLYDAKLDNKKMYYDGGTSMADAKQSYRPIAGIESIAVDFKNKFGGIRKATINWKCHTLDELELLSPYFLAPGYTMLLEWGWTSGADNVYTGNYGDLTLTNYFEKIQEKIVKSEGTYDAMLGIIVNYSYNVNSDLSYDCTTDIISTGYLMEGISLSNQKYKGSVATNPLNPCNPTNESNQPTPPTDSVADPQESTLITFIQTQLPLIMKSEVNNSYLSNHIQNTDGKNGIWHRYTYPTSDVENLDKIVFIDSVHGSGGDRFDSTKPDNIYSSMYLSWGFIEDVILNEYGTIIKEGNDNTDPKNKDDALTIYDSSGIAIKNNKYLRSCDLNICIIPNDTDTGAPNGQPNELFGFKFGDDIYSGFDLNKLTVIKKHKYWEDKTKSDANYNNVGFVRNILINYEFFKNEFTKVDNLDDNIANMFNKISNACGNVWDFKVSKSPDGKRAFVTDINFTDIQAMGDLQILMLNTRTTKIGGDNDKNKIKKKVKYIESTTANKVFESIVKSISVDVKLSAQVATNVFYQSHKKATDNNQVNSPSEAYSQFFYTAYGDMFIKSNYVATNSNIVSTTTTTEEEKIKTTSQQQMESNLYSWMLVGYLPMYKSFESEKEAYWYELGMKRLINQNSGTETTNNTNTIVPAIVPMTATLTIDGVSGIKIGDMIQLDCIQNNYLEKGAFQITGLKQSINNSGWDTEITAMFRVLLMDVKTAVAKAYTYTKSNQGGVATTINNGVVTNVRTVGGNTGAGLGNGQGIRIANRKSHRMTTFMGYLDTSAIYYGTEITTFTNNLISVAKKIATFNIQEAGNGKTNYETYNGNRQNDFIRSMYYYFDGTTGPRQYCALFASVCISLAYFITHNLYGVTMDILKDRQTLMNFFNKNESKCVSGSDKNKLYYATQAVVNFYNVGKSKDAIKQQPSPGCFIIWRPPSSSHIEIVIEVI